jgi:ubiquinone/menaquinone biosynthesis C-methylase UbiE
MATPDAQKATSTGHRLAAGHHLDLHYDALRREYDEALRFAHFQAGWHVLDAGAGNGAFLPLMCRMLGPSGKVDAVDLSPENVASIAEIRKLACPVVPRVGDITELPYDNNSFDAVWSANVSQYLTNEQLTQAMSEFRRVVKPRGVITIKEVDISVWQFQPQDPLLMWRLLESVQDDTQLAGAMRGTRLPVWFREAGLERISSRSTLAERRQPLQDAERRYIASNLEFLSNLALLRDLPAADLAQWREIAERPDDLLDHPDFCYRELFVVTCGRKPSAQPL